MAPRWRRGTFEEVSSFARACLNEEVAADFERTASLAALGPVTPEEEMQRRIAGAASRAAATAEISVAPILSPGRQAMLESMGDCASELAITKSGTTVTLTVQNATPGKLYDVFRTMNLVGDSVEDSTWRWIAKRMNGQSLVVQDPRCHAVYVLGCDQDTDSDGLTDAFEGLVSKTNPNDPQTTDGLPDVDAYLRSNLLVNDPMQDCGNEQNTQFESTCAVLNGKVIVAYVDSNRAVYGLGDDPRLSSRTPQVAGYSVSSDGGLTFVDKDVPPLARAGAPTNDDGDAGDPVLAVDRVSGVIYLAGTAPRNAGHKGIPLWKSTDGGVTFGTPIIVRDDITLTDKPWITVDD